jgi:cellulose synthase/poly-beta-1,6-N-acetylglucosamine synthase-like glycosyltransferase
MNWFVVYPSLLLALIWIAYPLAIRVIGAWRGRDDSRAHRSPCTTVSVIVASADDAQSIRDRVADLLAATYPAELVEIVVGLDATYARATIAELSDLDARVRVVQGDAPGGKATTLNAAVRAASHEHLVFADTAQRFHPSAIAELVVALDDPRLGAVSGMLDLPGRDGSLNLAERYWRYERWLRFWESRVHSAVGVTGAIYAMRRSLWTPLPAGLILDDVYLPLRLILDGWRVGFTDRAIAYDTRRFRPDQEFRRKVRTLTGNIQVCAWLPGVLHPLSNAVWVQFLCHKLLRLLTPYLAALVLLGLGVMVVRAVTSSPLALLVTAALTVAFLGACLHARVRRAVRTQIAWGVALQGSVVLAAVNGMRGKWDVWSRSA